MQSAYEILSDPQERAWYDSHRDQILRGGDEASGEHYQHNVRITTADDLMRIFTLFHGKVDFSDSATGFYGVLRETFDTLAREEELACEWEGLDPVVYPSFGHAADNYEDVVRPFYAAWNGFATKKTFSWEDIYRLSDAPDRRLRRMMEKENKRFRETGIRDFNDAVRSLVAFVKKRDPRFKSNFKSEAERQKILKDAAKAQAARQRVANQAKQASTEAVPQWMKSKEVQDDEISDDAKEKVTEQFECVICNKSFKSEKQYEAHEKSRKHVRAVQHLKRRMQQEDKSLRLDELETKGAGQEPLADAVEEDGAAEEVPDHQIAEDQIDSTENLNNSDEKLSQVSQAEESGNSEEDSHEPVIGQNDSAATLDTPASSSDDEYTTREKVEERIVQGQEEKDSSSSGLKASISDIKHLSEQLATESLGDTSDSNPQPKMGKAKEKRAKKAAKTQGGNTTASDSEFKCAACQAAFPSKTRLFNHIKGLGHAQPVPKSTKGGKGRK